MDVQVLGPGSAFPEWMEVLDASAFGESWHILVEGELGFVAAGRGFALWRVTPAAEEAELLRVAVHPDHRRRGLAAALLAASETALRREGIRTLLLEVRVSNQAARALYRRQGWTEAGQRKGYYKDGEDAALYRRELGQDQGPAPGTGSL
jgi:ribosomal-protein-alanine N-acetyltransferase